MQALQTDHPVIERPSGLTPMMEQYWDVKEAHPECLVFYRMGDFYELFYDDALIAAPILDISLTKRGKGADGADIPMCGVPAHSYETYLPRLIRAGKKVAVCEQVETPQEAKERGGHKALVKRDVVRIITAGTLTEDTLLEAHDHAYLACLIVTGAGQAGLSWMDVSTGEFLVENADLNALPALLSRVDPRELLVSDALIQDPRLYEVLAPFKSRLSVQANSLFDKRNAHQRLLDLYGVATLEGLGSFESHEISAAGCLLDYARRTQKGALPHIRAIQKITSDSVMLMDGATRRNLEILKTLSGERKGSLISVLDRTKTGAGGRLLAARLRAPSANRAVIEARHQKIDHFMTSPDLCEGLSDSLSRMPDIERALARITLGRGAPRDLGQIRDALQAIETLRRDLQESGNPEIKSYAVLLQFSPDLTALYDHLSSALGTDLPFTQREGGFIANGFSSALDELRSLNKQGRNHILELERSYVAETGIQSLKIKYNNVLGWFIDVTSKHADQLLNWGDQAAANDDMATPLTGRTQFKHRQTLASAVRFTTTSLTELEGKIAQACERAIAMELEMFDQLIGTVIQNAPELSTLAEEAADIDVSVTHAAFAREHHYSRPLLHDDTRFHIEQGRHPVVEAALAKGDFTHNDCTLHDDKSSLIWLLTGPNMAGKSTFLRQNALIALMAQAGLFVPAAQAEIGLIDQIFSRVGAADDLAKGQSTFMVEMVETAAILNQATERSLVILDEIGRGTATFDGLSIAWAVLEYLHEASKCRTLFATHYHELSGLLERLPNLRAARVDVKEWQGDIVFLHKVVEGSADKSYGIHVARIAGLPSSVLTRAQSVLSKLEAKKQDASPQDLPLFEIADTTTEPPSRHPAMDALEAINPDELTPRDALDTLYRVKAIFEG